MILTDDEPRSTMYGSGRERGGHSVSRGPAGPTRTPHGSTRDVIDSSPVCAEAGAYTAAARHDYSDLLDDDEVPSEQPWHRQLRRDNDGSGEYDEHPHRNMMTTT